MTDQREGKPFAKEGDLVRATEFTGPDFRERPA